MGMVKCNLLRPVSNCESKVRIRSIVVFGTWEEPLSLEFEGLSVRHTHRPTPPPFRAFFHF